MVVEATNYSLHFPISTCTYINVRWFIMLQGYAKLDLNGIFAHSITTTTTSYQPWYRHILHVFQRYKNIFMSEKFYFCIEWEPKPLSLVRKVKYSSLITGLQRKDTVQEVLFYLPFPIYSPDIAAILKTVFHNQHYLQTYFG